MRLVVLTYVVLAAACSYDLDAHPGACRTRDECRDGAECYRGFCVAAAAVRDAAISAARDAATAARDAASAQCDDDVSSQDCYDGPPETAGIGVCRAGRRFCLRGELTECFDQVTPSAESCNGRDDDCNGEVDDVEPRPCQVAIEGRCSLEGTVVCRSGVPSCELAAATRAETCNGLDDDCDGVTDEQTSMSSSACFPQGKSGCSGDASSGFQCLGVCKAGRVSCANESSQCDGAITAATEACTASGTALDEDCDGRLDEGCACEAGATRACYTGPAETIGRSPCKEGTQTCTGGAWSACTKQVLPQPESCTNPGVDDDCDGVIDDVAGVGDACTDATKLGACRNGTLLCQSGHAAPVCVGSAPSTELCDALDQDCDGNPVNGFDLNSNARCGSCDVSCSATEVCCGGRCMERQLLETDPEHCGECGHACGSNQYCCQGTCLDERAASTAIGPEAVSELTACNCAMDCHSNACCGTRCVDLIKDPRNCGACGYECSAHQECKGGACKEKP